MIEKMKLSFLKFWALPASLLLLNACVLDDEKQNHGTVLGVTACISKNMEQSKLISETLVKQQCINKHEQILNKRYDPRNRANVYIEDDQMVVSASTLVNNFDDIVITSIELSGCYRDVNGKENCKSKWVHDIWAEPNKFFSGTVKVQYDYKGATIDAWCTKLEDKKNCKGWDILRYKGLKIKLQ